MSSREFDMQVTREGHYWVGEVPDLPGAATESRQLRNLAAEMIDLLSGLLDLDPEAIDVHPHYDFAHDTSKALKEYDSASRSLADARSFYERAQHRAATQLQENGVSIRDAAYLMDVSFQRVQQILNPAVRAQ